MNDRVELKRTSLAEDLAALGLLKDGSPLPQKERGTIVGFRKYSRYCVKIDGHAGTQEFSENDLCHLPVLDRLAEL